jgi:hypothetical protein
VVERCAQGLALLERIDPSGFDGATVTAWATGVERLRRQSEAAAIAVTEHLDTAQPFRDQGVFTAKAWMKHRLQLSGVEAYGRVQEARLRRAVRVWNNALADQIGTAQKAQRNRERRLVVVHQNADGGWDLHAKLDGVAGPEFLEIFSWYVDREFARDWGEATGRLGEGNVDVASLQRTEPQRRADALLEMARAAACPPDRERPLPTVNFLLDATTAAVCDNDLPDPAAHRALVARTDRGHRVDPNAIIAVSLWALIRRVVTDARGVVIDLGGATRLFTGHARTAVMLLEPTCIWPGCDQPHTWCHADHLTSWTTRGPTDEVNGAPLRPRHNSLKERGFTVYLDDAGRWHVVTPDGTDVC